MRIERNVAKFAGIGRERASCCAPTLVSPAEKVNQMLAWCEMNQVDFVFGLARNARLVEEISVELLQAEAEASATGKPARRFKDFRYATLDSWSRRRQVDVAKAEWTNGEANPRFIVTSLNKAETSARFLFENVSCASGEMEPAHGMPRRPVRRPNLDRNPCATSCDSGSPRSPMRSCALSGASVLPSTSPKRPAAQSGSSSSSSPVSSASARGASNSRSPQPVPTPTNGGWPPPASSQPPDASPRRRKKRGNPTHHPPETPKRPTPSAQTARDALVLATATGPGRPKERQGGLEAGS